MEDEEEKCGVKWDVINLVEEGKELVGFTEIGTKLKILLHALIGSNNLKTTRVEWKLASQWVVILIDSSSTHNFIDTTAAK